MLQANENSDTFGVLVLDVESTGPKYIAPVHAKDNFSTGLEMRDVAFAIGYAIGTSEGKMLQSGRFCMALSDESIADPESWNSLWRRNGYDMDTFSRFWFGSEENQKVFYRLQDKFDRDNHMCSNESQFAYNLHDLLRYMDSNFTRWSIWTDCPAFDPSILNALLLRHGYYPLNFDSNEEYHCDSVMDVDSALKARYGYMPGEEVSDDSHYTDVEKQYDTDRQVDADHMPDNDAVDIFQKFMYLWKRAK